MYYCYYTYLIISLPNKKHLTKTPMNIANRSACEIFLFDNMKLLPMLITFDYNINL